MSSATVNRKVLKFRNSLHKEFNKTLNRRINDYFKESRVGRYANLEMIVKTIFMFFLYLSPYFLVLFGIIKTVWLFYILAFVMGLGKAGIGLSVMHDAIHGAYSRKRWVNTLIGYSLNLVGGNATNWKIQHNVKHHTYTNVLGMDEDITPRGGILRFDPFSEIKKYHKWQFIYAWFLYGFMTMSWIIVKDIVQLIEYTKDGLLKKQTKSVLGAWIWLIVSKLLYYAYTIILPILFTSFAWYHIIAGFFLMHYVAGFTLAIIFQPAHVMEENSYEDSSKGKEVVEESWAVHQLKTTCNFAQKNKILSWYVGGLNYQIEHHLFPNVCHVHYRKIAKIVRKTANEFDIPYNSYPTFRSALVSHGKMLYALGR